MLGKGLDGHTGLLIEFAGHRTASPGVKGAASQAKGQMSATPVRKAGCRLNRLLKKATHRAEYRIVFMKWNGSRCGARIFNKTRCSARSFRKNGCRRITSPAPDPPDGKRGAGGAGSGFQRALCRRGTGLDTAREAVADTVAYGLLYHPQRAATDGADQLQSAVPLVCRLFHGR